MHTQPSRILERERNKKGWQACLPEKKTPWVSECPRTFRQHNGSRRLRVSQGHLSESQELKMWEDRRADPECRELPELRWRRPVSLTGDPALSWESHVRETLSFVFLVHGRTMLKKTRVRKDSEVATYNNSSMQRYQEPNMQDSQCEASVSTVEKTKA